VAIVEVLIDPDGWTAHSTVNMQVNFEEDVIISQMNEYEVLQLLMGECREALAAYKTSLEEDTKMLQVRRCSRV
jgi:hypothetical protein